MAKRLTDTDIWDKQWFMELEPRLKCAVKFIRDKCDLSGVWSPNWILINTYIGDKAIKVTKEEILNIDKGNQFLELENGRIFCFQFIEFQNGILPDENAEKISPIHRKILGMLKSNDLEKKENGYIYPINRVLDRGIVIVGVKEEVIVKVEKGVQGEKQTLIFPFETEKFKTAWNVLSKEKKWIKKSFSALQASLKKLSNYDEQTAIKMIEDCIAGEWQGLVEPKLNNNFNGKQVNSNQIANESFRILQERKGTNG